MALTRWTQLKSHYKVWKHEFFAKNTKMMLILHGILPYFLEVVCFLCLNSYITLKYLNEVDLRYLWSFMNPKIKYKGSYCEKCKILLVVKDVFECHKVAIFSKNRNITIWRNLDAQTVWKCHIMLFYDSITYLNSYWVIFD